MAGDLDPLLHPSWWRPLPIADLQRYSNFTFNKSFMVFCIAYVIETPCAYSCSSNSGGTKSRKEAGQKKHRGACHYFLCFVFDAALHLFIKTELLCVLYLLSIPSCDLTQELSFNIWFLMWNPISKKSAHLYSSSPIWYHLGFLFTIKVACQPVLSFLHLILFSIRSWDWHS